MGGGEVWYSLIHGHLVLYSHKIFGLNVILRKAEGEREGGCNEDHWYGVFYMLAFTARCVSSLPVAQFVLLLNLILGCTAGL